MRRFPLVLLLAGVPAFAAAADCKFTAQRDFDVDAAGLKSVAFKLGASDLHVEGVPGLTKVEVRGRACASDQDWLAGLTVDQRRSGDVLTVTANTERHNGWHWFESSYAWIELRVRVPAQLAIATDGGSADVDARGIASLDFSSGSGDLEASRIAGALTTSAGSGDVEVDDVGSVEVRRTGSGDITLRNVRGDVKVARAGSADLKFDQVGGSVDVGNIGSGDVVAEHVQRDVTIGSIGSGDIDVSEIGGNFSVRAKGSGDVHQRGVRGTVSMPVERD